MNEQQKPMTPAEQLQHELTRLVWVAQDLQQRASIDEVQEIAYVRIAELTRHSTAIRELLDSTKTANINSPATSPAADVGATSKPEKATSTSAYPSAEPLPAGRPPAKPSKGGG
jgi:hypothetical protein